MHFVNFANSKCNLISASVHRSEEHDRELRKSVENRSYSNRLLYDWILSSQERKTRPVSSGNQSETDRTAIVCCTTGFSVHKSEEHDPWAPEISRKPIVQQSFVVRLDLRFPFVAHGDGRLAKFSTDINSSFSEINWSTEKVALQQRLVLIQSRTTQNHGAKKLAFLNETLNLRMSGRTISKRVPVQSLSY